MRHRKVCPALLVLVVSVALSPVTAQAGEAPPRLLHPHPERDPDGPYWVAASYALSRDGTVRSAERIGSTLAARLLDEGRRLPPPPESVSEDTPPTELGCEITPEEERSLRELLRLPRQTVFPPGDFRGWTAASDAVVLGTVTGFAPGFDHKGNPNTLVLLEATEHLYPSRAYPYIVKYAILPYARFVAGGRVFCAPAATHQEYYPEVGDRLLIAADRPADRNALAMTVMSMSRVVQVRNDGCLATYGQSDLYSLVFDPDFPETLDDAKVRAWDVWRDGFVDLADTLGHEEFTKLWRDLKIDAAEAVGPGCFVIGVLPEANGWTLSTSCPPSGRNGAPDPIRSPLFRPSEGPIPS